MEDKSLTKKELLEKIKELKEVNNAAKDMASAVEEKDRKIKKLQDKIGGLEETYQNKIDKLKKAHADKIESLNKNKKTLEDKLKDREQNLESEIQKRVLERKKEFEVKRKDMENKIQMLTEFGDKRTRELQELVEIHNALLKSLQGSLDTSITLSGYFEEKIKK